MFPLDLVQNDEMKRKAQGPQSAKQTRQMHALSTSRATSS